MKISQFLRVIRRRAAVMGLFIMLLAFRPAAFALTPGPTVIRQCPACTNALKQFTIGSGNTFGAKFWTDGFMLAPMLPLRPALVKCPYCRKLIWIEDAKELDRLGARAELEKRMRQLQEAEQLERDGHHEEAEKLKQQKDNVTKRVTWDQAKTPIEPEESDYLKAASVPNISRDREFYARQRAWWLANDPARDDPGKKVRWTKARKQNLARLDALLDTTKDCELVCKAEIARELGQFDVCLKLLSQPVSKDCNDTASLVARLAKNKQAQVEELP